MSRQAYRLERQLPKIHDGSVTRLGEARPGSVVWAMASKQAEFGHLVVDGYRNGRYAPAAALVRTLFEDATLLAWFAAPEDPGKQALRIKQMLVTFFRDAKHKGTKLQPDAEELLRTATGHVARKVPSWENRVQQLDAIESRQEDGKPFWTSHRAHVDFLNAYVHSDLAGIGQFTDPMTRELLGIDALVFAHQYLTLSIVNVARLSDQTAMADRATAAFARVRDQQRSEMSRLQRDDN